MGKGILQVQKALLFNRAEVRGQPAGFLEESVWHMSDSKRLRFPADGESQGKGRIELWVLPGRHNL